MDRTGADPEALLAGLHDVRLPVEAAGGAPAEILAALGLGLLLALCLAPAIRALTRPRQAPAADDLAARLAALDALPAERRRDALLRLVAEHRPQTLRAIEPAIYRPDGLPSAEALEAELRRGPA